MAFGGTNMIARKQRWLIVSIAFGAAFWLLGGYVPAGPLHMAFKGTAVAILAWYALEQSTSVTRPIGVIMAFGALGDVLIEIDLAIGAMAFLCGHFFACWFYVQNRRPLTWANAAAGGAAVVAIPALVSVVLPGQTSVLAYACGLAAMVGCAWCSRFRRDRVALGALLFAASDVLLFARMGVLSDSPLAGPVAGALVWPLYFGGQVLITLGVVNRAQLMLAGSSASRGRETSPTTAAIGRAQ